MARRTRRSVPARRRGTRKGMRRRTSRRAFTGLRRRRRSNPKGILQQPAARNALWALGGASAEIVLNQTPLLQKQVKHRLASSAIFAALTIFIGQTSGAHSAASHAGTLMDIEGGTGVQVINENASSALTVACLRQEFVHGHMETGAHSRVLFTIAEHSLGGHLA